MRQTGLFGLSDHLKRLSADGDPLEVLAQVVDFETFRPTLIAALAYGDGAKGGRPPYDPLAMLKVLILAGAEQCRRCADGISDPRPAELASVAGLRHWCGYTRCQHDPSVGCSGT